MQLVDILKIIFNGAKCKERKNYKLFYHSGLKSITDYLPECVLETDNLSDCEKADTENQFSIKFEIDTADRVDYYSTALNILSEGKKLSILRWQDFEIS